MKNGIGRRQALKLATLLPVGISSQAISRSDVNHSNSIDVGLFNDISRLHISEDVAFVRTSGFWQEGEGQQILERVTNKPKYFNWPRYIQSADSSLWCVVDGHDAGKVFGEIADGKYHALSERFTKLEQAKRIYPFVTSLVQSIDWAAMQTLVKYAIGGEVAIGRGIRIITDPIRVPARVIIVGECSDPSNLSFRAHGASGAFGNGRGVFESENYMDLVNPDYWHWSTLRQIAVDAAGIADHGISLWCMGEQSLLEDVWVQGAKTANIYIGGYGAVGTLRNCSVWKAGKYGVWMTGHPLSNFPKKGHGVIGADGNGGSYRINNLSGDHNPVHIRADGSQIVELTGLKSEMSPIVISIGGSRSGPARQRWDISGFRAEGGRFGEAFIRIDEGATPSIQVGPGATYNYDILIDDLFPNGHQAIKAGQAGVTSLSYSRDRGDATIIATDRLSFFGAEPRPKGSLPPTLGSTATGAERDALLNAIRQLLVGYGLA